MQGYAIFPCGIESFPHRNGPSPYVFDSFRCGFSPSTIGLVLETCGFMRFRFCSVPDPYVLAADPRFLCAGSMWSRRRENRPRGVDGSPSTDNHSTQKGEVNYDRTRDCKNGIQEVARLRRA